MTHVSYYYSHSLHIVTGTLALCLRAKVAINILLPSLTKFAFLFFFLSPPNYLFIYYSRYYLAGTLALFLGASVATVLEWVELLFFVLFVGPLLVVGCGASCLRKGPSSGKTLMSHVSYMS